MKHVLFTLMSAFLFFSAVAAKPQTIGKEAHLSQQQKTTTTESPSSQTIIDKVDKAAEIVTREGEASFPKFRAKGNEFIFSGTYVWVQSLEGKMLMHPISPELEGRDIFYLRDVNGKMFIIEMNKIVLKQGHGWVQYLWPKPGEQAPSLKVSYVRLAKHNNKTYIVGCGIYDMPIEDIKKIQENNE